MTTIDSLKAEVASLRARLNHLKNPAGRVVLLAESSVEIKIDDALRRTLITHYSTQLKAAESKLINL
jgi:hypothetical protein